MEMTHEEIESVISHRSGIIESHVAEIRALTGLIIGMKKISIIECPINHNEDNKSHFCEAGNCIICGAIW
jgi:hypothetical protein